MPTPRAGYFLKDGTKVPGTTTILSRWKDSGALLFWAFEQGKCCQRGEINGLYDKRDQAATSGTLAHTMVEKYINGEPLLVQSDYPKEIWEQATQGFKSYLNWAEDNRIIVVDQEFQLVSEKYAYGGTPDAIGINSRNETVLIDYKTSSSGPYVDWLLQLAAYKILWEENNPDKPITGGMHLLRFSKENADFHHHFWSELEVAEEQFLLLRKAYSIDKLLKKRL